MAQQRSHSIEFKRQVAQEFIAGETLHGLAKRYDVSRNLIRIWVSKYEEGAFDDDAIVPPPAPARSLICFGGISGLFPTRVRENVVINMPQRAAQFTSITYGPVPAVGRKTRDQMVPTQGKKVFWELFRPKILSFRKSKVWEMGLGESFSSPHQLDISFHPPLLLRQSTDNVLRQSGSSPSTPNFANLAIEKREKTMANPVIAFINDKDLETLIYVHEIAKDDPTLVVDIHTWKPRNARKALEVLRAAIDDLLDEWDTGKYFKLPPATEDDTKPRPVHYHWPLRIHHQQQPGDQMT